MSIATEITRINDAKAAIKAAIVEKGVDVSDLDKIDVLAGYISMIGGTEPTNYALAHYPYSDDIAGELQRIIDSKANIRQAIIDKGVDVPDSEMIDAYADYILEIATEIIVWVYTKEWKYKSRQGEIQWPRYSWSDGENIYYDYFSTHKIYDKTTSTWVNNTWNIDISSGTYIWTDGTNIYYSYGSNQYVLDKGTKTWSPTTWNGLTEPLGSNVWTDGENIYCYNRKLDISTSTWNTVPNQGYASMDSYWTDGENVYYSSENIQRIFDGILPYGDNKKEWYSIQTPLNYRGRDVFWIPDDNVFVYINHETNEAYYRNNTSYAWTKIDNWVNDFNNIEDFFYINNYGNIQACYKPWSGSSAMYLRLSNSNTVLVESDYSSLDLSYVDRPENVWIFGDETFYSNGWTTINLCTGESFDNDIEVYGRNIWVYNNVAYYMDTNDPNRCYYCNSPEDGHWNNTDTFLTGVYNFNKRNVVTINGTLCYIDSDENYYYYTTDGRNRQKLYSTDGMKGVDIFQDTNGSYSYYADGNNIYSVYKQSWSSSLEKISRQENEVVSYAPKNAHFIWTDGTDIYYDDFTNHRASWKYNKEEKLFKPWDGWTGIDDLGVQFNYVPWTDNPRKRTSCMCSTFSLLYDHNFDPKNDGIYVYNHELYSFAPIPIKSITSINIFKSGNVITEITEPGEYTFEIILAPSDVTIIDNLQVKSNIGTTVLFADAYANDGILRGSVTVPNKTFSGNGSIKAIAGSAVNEIVFPINTVLKNTYSVNLNDQWKASTYSKPSGATNYDMYMSNSNYNVNSGVATMYINFDIGWSGTFKIYINSYAESSYDYTRAYALDSTSSILADTKGFQYTPTESMTSNYKAVTYTIPNDGKTHQIKIDYRKDGSVNSNYDRGFVLIPKP